jgi:hypothetical protein
MIAICIQTPVPKEGTHYHGPQLFQGKNTNNSLTSTTNYLTSQRIRRGFTQQQQVNGNGSINS